MTTWKEKPALSAESATSSKAMRPMAAVAGKKAVPTGYHLNRLWMPGGTAAYG